MQMRARFQKKCMILLPFCSMLILSFFMSSAYGHEQIHVSNLEGIHIFKSDSIGFFGNTTVYGALGSESGSDLIFLGKKWECKLPQK